MFCSTKPLGKGARCAPPLHPPGCGFDQALSHPKPKTYRRFTTRRRLRSPCTHRSFQEDQGLSRPLNPTRNLWPLHYQSGERSCCPRYPHDQFLETTSWRRGRELSRIPSFDPTHRAGAHRAPCNPDQPCAVWIRAIWRQMDHLLTH